MTERARQTDRQGRREEAREGGRERKTHLLKKDDGSGVPPSLHSQPKIPKEDQDHSTVLLLFNTETHVPSQLKEVIGNEGRCEYIVLQLREGGEGGGGEGGGCGGGWRRGGRRGREEGRRKGSGRRL